MSEPTKAERGDHRLRVSTDPEIPARNMSTDRFIERIHATSTKIVLAVSGGGSEAISQLLRVPGASATVLEAVVPYSAEAMVRFLGGSPDQYCSAPTARAMAMRAFLRAGELAGMDQPVAGVGGTASLATTRPKRGEHRLHVAFQTLAATTTVSVRLAKAARTRKQEERLVARLLLNVVAEACGLDAHLPVQLAAEETLSRNSITAPQPWRQLLGGQIDRCLHAPLGCNTDEAPPVVFPGAFNPIHRGHLRMIQVAEQRLGVRAVLEVLVLNVDKPLWDYQDLHDRLQRIGPRFPVWLTRASTFAEKARLFPGATFVVGADTIARIADPRYYGGSRESCRAALRQIARRGCRFLVFGRRAGGEFLSLSRLKLPKVLVEQCEEVPEEEFRDDISSTELRRGEGG